MLYATRKISQSSFDLNPNSRIQAKLNRAHLIYKSKHENSDKKFYKPKYKN